MSLIEKYKGQIEEELNVPMNDKYELTDETMEYGGYTLHRIRALRDIRLVTGNTLRAGSLGGWVETVWNLSDKGNCWVHNDAMVMGVACVMGDALVLHNSIVYDSAIIDGSAKIEGKSTINRHSCISGTALVRNSTVTDFATVNGLARILNDGDIRSNITDHGEVGDHATVKGGTVTDRAVAAGTCFVRCNGVLSQHQYVCSGNVISDISEDLSESIRLQTGLIPVNGKVIAYKQVRKGENGVFCSMYDADFVYEVGKVVEVQNPNTDPTVSCGSGLHFSNANYWNDMAHGIVTEGLKRENATIRDTSFLAAEINLDDVLAVQEGKIRCRRAKIIGSYDIK